VQREQAAVHGVDVVIATRRVTLLAAAIDRERDSQLVRRARCRRFACAARRREHTLQQVRDVDVERVDDLLLGARRRVCGRHELGGASTRLQQHAPARLVGAGKRHKPILNAERPEVLCNRRHVLVHDSTNPRRRRLVAIIVGRALVAVDFASCLFHKRARFSARQTQRDALVVGSPRKQLLSALGV
jgi:hypothetical protein